jgi:hypothetical protein
MTTPDRPVYWQRRETIAFKDGRLAVIVYKQVDDRNLQPLSAGLAALHCWLYPRPQTRRHRWKAT